MERKQSAKQYELTSMKSTKKQDLMLDQQEIYKTSNNPQSHGKDNAKTYPSLPAPTSKNTALDPSTANAFTTCNQGIANGFGQMFFNLRDPEFMKTHSNVPTKVRPQLHLPVVFANIIFLAGLVVGLVDLNSFLTIGASIIIIVSSYLVYIIVTFWFSEVRRYLSNSKRMEEYEGTFNKMKAGKGFFTFKIKCYHYTRRRNGRSHKRVTHRAKEIFTITQMMDQSGKIQEIADIKGYMFVRYLKRFYFNDQLSEARFIMGFNNFVNRHSRDRHQSYSHNMEIQGYEEFVAYSAEGSKSGAILFYVFMFLGLALPFECLVERRVERYDVGLLKRFVVLFRIFLIKICCY